MTSVQQHYDNHLASFYGWLSGNFEQNVQQATAFLQSHNITPRHSGVALDLGAAHGIYSVALAQRGFSVKAIDFNTQLLAELDKNNKNLDITTINDDIRNITRYQAFNAEILVCMGDTITHLDNVQDITNFIDNCINLLDKNGILMLSFRDYSNELTGNQRFIPVRSDDERIALCFLEYTPNTVFVTDILYQKTEQTWKQTISTYPKVRIATSSIQQILQQKHMNIVFNSVEKGFVTIIAIK